MNEIMGISRLRMGTGGRGITTLVTFYGCPLSCAYCLNPQCNDKDTVRAEYSPEELMKIVEIDDIYFQMTGGGITFGGGEPLLYNKFIHQFCKIANPAWKIRVETSLNVPWEKVKLLLSDVDLWFIDIKDLNENIYRKYTGTGNRQVIENLMKLNAMILQERICIRVPLIPGYNTEKDIENSLSILRKFSNIDRLTYIQ